MAAFLLFILAGVILVITFWNFKKKPAPGEDQRSDYQQSNMCKHNQKLAYYRSKYNFIYIIVF